MIYKHKNYRDKDLGETVPNLHIDLEKAAETHTIRATGVIPEFNAIESTDEVGPVVRDAFAAIDTKNAILEQLKSQQPQQPQQGQQPQSPQPSQPEQGA